MSPNAIPDADPERDQPISRLEADLALLIRILESRYRRRHYPLERAHYLLLSALLEGPQRSGTLTGRLVLDHSTVTRQIAAMEKRDLVIKRADPQDKRSSLVEASPLGVRRAAEMRALRLQRLHALLAGWSADDVAQFAGLVARLNVDLKAAEDTAAHSSDFAEG